MSAIFSIVVLYILGVIADTLIKHIFFPTILDASRSFATKLLNAFKETTILLIMSLFTVLLLSANNASH